MIWELVGDPKESLLYWQSLKKILNFPLKLHKSGLYGMNCS